MVSLSYNEILNAGRQVRNVEDESSLWLKLSLVLGVLHFLSREWIT